MFTHCTYWFPPTEPSVSGGATPSAPCPSKFSRFVVPTMGRCPVSTAPSIPGAPPCLGPTPAHSSILIVPLEWLAVKPANFCILGEMPSPTSLSDLRTLRLMATVLPQCANILLTGPASQYHGLPITFSDAGRPR